MSDSVANSVDSVSIKGRSSFSFSTIVFISPKEYAFPLRSNERLSSSMIHNPVQFFRNVITPSLPTSFVNP